MPLSLSLKCTIYHTYIHSCSKLLVQHFSKQPYRQTDKDNKIKSCATSTSSINSSCQKAISIAKFPFSFCCIFSSLYRIQDNLTLRTQLFQDLQVFAFAKVDQRSIDCPIVGCGNYRNHFYLLLGNLF